MPTPFALLESRLNSVAVAQLANVTATIAGLPVDGIFDNKYIETLDIVGTVPVFTCLTATVGSVVRGNTVTIRTVNYVVRDIQHDGTGMTDFILKLPG